MFEKFSVPAPHVFRRAFYFAAALARSARASRRLNLASSMTPDFVSVSILKDIGERRKEHVPASASLEKLPVQVIKVCPSCLPDVTGYARMVLTTLV